ncbi:MAG: hypothetical protein GY903_05415, partial [Fuerstiella sp.]|nr:hypothetical protein [Fuerstiella sp.]
MLIETQHCVCPNECAHVGPLNALNKHLKVCPNREVCCPFAELGCSAKIPLSKIDEHLDACQHDHMALMCSSATQMTQAISVQGTRLSRLSNHVSGLAADTQTNFVSLEKRVARMESVQNEVNTVVLDTLGKIQASIAAQSAAVAAASTGSSRAKSSKAAGKAQAVPSTPPA